VGHRGNVGVGGGPWPGPPALAIVTKTASNRLSASIFRVGLDYKFGVPRPSIASLRVAAARRCCLAGASSMAPHAVLSCSRNGAPSDGSAILRLNDGGRIAPSHPRGVRKDPGGRRRRVLAFRYSGGPGRRVGLSLSSRRIDQLMPAIFRAGSCAASVTSLEHLRIGNVDSFETRLWFVETRLVSPRCKGSGRQNNAGQGNEKK
jgi:hypothetical protein